MAFQLAKLTSSSLYADGQYRNLLFLKSVIISKKAYFKALGLCVQLPYG
jgi:hypothetical protein